MSGRRSPWAWLWALLKRLWHKVWPPKEDDSDWFKKLCEEQRPHWEAAISEAKAEDAAEVEKDRDYQPRTRREIEEFLAANATSDLQRMDNELTSMLTRSAIIGTVAALLFAIYSFINTEVGVARAFLGLALCFALAAVVLSVVPLSPPFQRAWREKYEKRHEWTLQATSYFKRWALDCWSADRRSPVIQRYKKVHSVVIRVLVFAAALALVALALSQFRA